MKKRILITILFLSVFTLSGCGQESSPQDKDQEPAPDQTPAQESATTTEKEQEEDTSSEEDKQSSEENKNESDEDGVSIEGWRTYSKELKNVKIQYPENWYYRRSLSQELDNDYYLYVEFAPTSKVLQGEATSSIELIGVDRDKEIEEGEYSTTVKETGDRKFILKTDSKERFQEEVDKMATTFQQPN